MSKVTPEVQHMYYKKHYEKNKLTFQKKTYMNSWLKNATFPNQGMIEKYNISKEELLLLLSNIIERYDIPSLSNELKIMNYEDTTMKYVIKEENFVYNIVSLYYDLYNEEVVATFDDMKNNILKWNDKKLVLSVYANFIKMKHSFDAHMKLHPIETLSDFSEEALNFISEAQKSLEYKEVLYNKLFQVLNLEKPIVDSAEEVKYIEESDRSKDDRFFCLLDAIENSPESEKLLRKIRGFEIDVMNKVNKKLFELKRKDIRNFGFKTSSLS